MSFTIGANFYSTKKPLTIALWITGHAQTPVNIFANINGKWIPVNAGSRVPNNNGSHVYRFPYQDGMVRFRAIDATGQIAEGNLSLAINNPFTNKK